jgi:polysaccharide export outer membrane protein
MIHSTSLCITIHRVTLLLLLMGIFGLAPKSAMAEYKLQPGDTLEISVAGFPELRQRSPIEVDGTIAVPLAGQFKVSGLSILEVRVLITANLSNMVYQQRTNDGREIQHLILPNEIIVAVSQYRPIYVNGDVARPGEHPFRAAMTVRHAVALAGGYDLVRFRLVNPFLQAADVRSEHEALWAEFAIEQARVRRLRTELGEGGVENDAAIKVPIPAELDQRLKHVATEQLKARVADREKSKALLEDAIEKMGSQMGILTEKKKKDEEGYQADYEDFEKVKQLAQRGVSTNVRLAEARRSALLSSNQLLQTLVEMANLERQRGEFTIRIEKIDSQNRIDAWKEMQEANLRLAQISARLRSTSDKLKYTGQLQSQLGRGKAGRVVITVYRKAEDGSDRLAGNEDMELAPGDVVDVALETESVVEALAPPKSTQ